MHRFALRTLLATAALAGCLGAMLLGALHSQAVQALAGGLPTELVPAAQMALLWSAVALPLAPGSRIDLSGRPG